MVYTFLKLLEKYGIRAFWVPTKPAWIRGNNDRGQEWRTDPVLGTTE